MCSIPVDLGRGLGVLLGVIVTTMAQGQQITVVKSAQVKAPPAKGAAIESPVPGSVHKIEIYEGPNRSVHYITQGNLPTSDTLAALELGRAENELTYVHNLQRLKQQYVNSERIMEPQRRYVQELLYGSSISYGRSFSGYGGGGYGGGGYYPYVWGSYGNPNLFSGYVGSSSLSVTRNLQFGMGDEGRFKDAMVQVIAQQSTPEYAASVVRNYDSAMARATSSPTLAKSLSLQKSATTYAEYEPSFTKGGKIVVWVQGSDKPIAGTVKDDRPGWVVIQTATSEVTVRKSEITRSEVPAKPAGGTD